jgi:hypothetical protein
LADIDSAKVYYTAGSQVFSPINKFGNTVLNPNGLLQIIGSRNLQMGDNYFWLAYDVKSTATINNVLDATYDSITISGINYTPTVSNPAGGRTILGAMAGNYNVGSAWQWFIYRLKSFSTHDNNSTPCGVFKKL